MPSTFDAEYIALTQLQGEALVAEDKLLAKVAKKVVSVKSFKALNLSTTAVNFELASDRFRRNRAL